MLSWLHQILGGSSPITGYIGSSVIVLDVVNQALVEGGVPHDLAGWLKFFAIFFSGLGIRFAKDQNKTNAPVPTDTAKTVAPKS